MGTTMINIRHISKIKELERAIDYAYKTGDFSYLSHRYEIASLRTRKWFDRLYVRMKVYDIQSADPTVQMFIPWSDVSSAIKEDLGEQGLPLPS